MSRIWTQLTTPVLYRLATDTLCVGTQGYPPRTERLQSLMIWLRQDWQTLLPTDNAARWGDAVGSSSLPKTLQLMVCREARRLCAGLAGTFAFFWHSNRTGGFMGRAIPDRTVLILF